MLRSNPFQLKLLLNPKVYSGIGLPRNFLSFSASKTPSPFKSLYFLSPGITTPPSVANNGVFAGVSSNCMIPSETYP